MKLKEILLTEATFNTDEVVDFVFEYSFKNFFDELNEYIKGRRIPSAMPLLPTKTITPDILAQNVRNETIQNAIDTNPVTIMTGLFNDGSWYSPVKQEIHVSFSLNAYKILKDFIDLGLSFKTIFEAGIIHQKDRPRFMHDVSGELVKSTIAHEVSHWLDDTYHNRHIHKRLRRAMSIPFEKREKALKIVRSGKSDINMTPFEIDAQVHSIKQARRKFTQQEWDQLTLRDLFNLYPSFYTISKRLSFSERQEWRKLLISRLHREGLLGRNMVPEDIVNVL